MSTALFQMEGKTARPSELSRGPWFPDAQHGGPPSALLTMLMESVAEPDRWLARMNVELLAPVPLTLLTTSVRSEQLSRRVAVAHAELHSGKKLVARATGRFLTEIDTVAAPEQPTDEAMSLPGPEAERVAPSWAVGKTNLAFHRDAIQHRWEHGDFNQTGPAQCWQRLTVPVVQGIEVTSHQRIMAVADIASGVSAIFMPGSGFGLINSDLDVTFLRPAIGEWIRTDATTRAGARGTGLCVNTLSDESGPVAFGTQTLLGRPFDFG
ncbi:MAG: thioesterase family protein [Acidimicrobiia bacterium]|nr:thioesterase family protein [Acidimicrobiia bacterium]